MQNKNRLAGQVECKFQSQQTCRRSSRLLVFVCHNDILSPCIRPFRPPAPPGDTPACTSRIRGGAFLCRRTYVVPLLGTDERYCGRHLARQFYCSTTMGSLAQAPIFCQSCYPRRERACQSSLVTLCVLNEPDRNLHSS